MTVTHLDQIRAQLERDDMNAINDLIASVEHVEIPSLPDVPSWDTSPPSLDCVGDETRTDAELIEIGRQWQTWANKIDDLLREISLEDFENELRSLQEKAERARTAMIAQGVYEVPYPSKA